MSDSAPEFAEIRRRLLRDHARDLRRIADELDAHAPSNAMSSLPLQQPEAPTMIQFARAWIRSHAAMPEIMGDSLFADPARLILLDLFVMEQEGRSVSVSNACMASGVPDTTALRWIAQLQDLNLIYRQPAAQDGRVVHLRLTSVGWDQVLACLSVMRSHLFRPLD
ncbi:hypothetical protein [uncultured Sphingomonas sp.]|uniref:hypothetical protein n=1 Tax=uncultured Sphingomonas sp. TaxID=158754 RepID=UPI0025E36616|nr:hypothetical protein [uncultured Sphingomonas sp.]